MLHKKMLRDIGRHKTQFISIFLMAFLAVFIYAGVGGEWRGLENSAAQFYRDTNLADVFIMGSGFSDENKEAVSVLEGVTETERRTTIEATGISVASVAFAQPPQLSLHFVESGAIAKPLVVSGREFDRNDKDSLWLDKRFSDANAIKVGDEITLSFMGISVTKRVAGIVYGGEYVFAAENDAMTPDFKGNGFGYLSHEAFPFPEQFVYTTLLVKTDNPRGLEDKISKALGGKYSVYLEQKDHPSVAMFNNETIQHKMMGDIFPVVFLLVALLTMLTTMTRIVLAQRTQIGTLKALGFKRRAITQHYISYGFWLALAGSLLGCAVGPLTLPHLFYPSMSSFYTMPQWKPAFDLSFFVVAATVVLLCTLVTWVAVARQLKDTPAATLRPKAPKTAKHSLVEKTALWKKLGFNSQWNLRDATRNKIRSTMAVIGVFGCTALLVCAFGMNDSMNLLKDWQYKKINRFETKITLEESVTETQTDSIISQTTGDAIMEGSIEIKANGIKKSGSVLVTDHTALICQTDRNRNPIALPEDGVSITSKMAKTLGGVKTGDEIMWHLYGNEAWVTSKVAAIYRSPSAQGITLSRSAFESLGYRFAPTSVVTATKVDARLEGAAATLSTSDIIKGWDDLTEAMLTMTFVLIAGAVLLAVVVLYNLGLLSFTEMERDMATLKVMGLKTKKLRGLLLTQNIWFSAVGFVLGLPGGLWLMKVITDASGDSFDFPIKLTVSTTLISFAITFGLSVFVNLLFSRKIKKLNMVESLKAIE